MIGVCLLDRLYRGAKREVSLLADRSRRCMAAALGSVGARRHREATCDGRRVGHGQRHPTRSVQRTPFETRFGLYDSVAARTGAHEIRGNPRNSAPRGLAAKRRDDLGSSPGTPAVRAAEFRGKVTLCPSFQSVQIPVERSMLRARVAAATGSGGGRTGPSRRRTRLIAGLIPPVLGAIDAAARRALDGRRDLIEARADAILDQALQAGASWTRALGVPPREAAAAWRSHARTVAAYRDRYGIRVTQAWGTEPQTDVQRADAVTLGPGHRPRPVASDCPDSPSVCRPSVLDCGRRRPPFVASLVAMA